MASRIVGTVPGAEEALGVLRPRAALGGSLGVLVPVTAVAPIGRASHYLLPVLPSATAIGNGNGNIGETGEGRLEKGRA
eukprot:CAMPEP_0178487974 /NCGR_PEP_ID=MMETSP0696-20121128/9606_1 /TAXON_ID=265572 /ORGANISM="Extubocellulus spinifer, Strain CCMP396" /LENGTH=78 /DNA_ID=CAMNT_0020115699 /DNA_START=320 /DNA_END=557 /DNA_ORIENTATION=-